MASINHFFVSIAWTYFKLRPVQVLVLHLLEGVANVYEKSRKWTQFGSEKAAVNTLAKSGTCQGHNLAVGQLKVMKRCVAKYRSVYPTTDNYVTKAKNWLLPTYASKNAANKNQTGSSKAAPQNGNGNGNRKLQLCAQSSKVAQQQQQQK